MQKIDLLVAKLRIGDRKTQNAVYRLLSPKMKAVCRRYAANSMEAEDILSEGFFKVFTKIDTYRGEGSFEGWVQRIMVNTALSSYKKNQRRITTCEFSAMGCEPVVPAEDNRLERLLDVLNDKYRTPFRLFALEGFSHEEIAGKMGISTGQSRVRVFRARASLKENINQYLS